MKNENISNEIFLKDLARQYVKTTGEIYKRENAAIIPEPTPGMDAKMKAARIRKRKTQMRTFMSFAASIIILIVVGVTFLPQFLRDEMHEYGLRRPASTEQAQNQAAGAADTPVAADMITPPPPPMGEAAPAEDDMLMWPVPEEENELFEIWGDITEAEMEALEDADIFGGWYSVSDEAHDAERAADIVDECDTLEMEALPVTTPSEPTPQMRNIAQISLSPPPGWQIVYTDFDGEKIIFHLEGEAQNRVIVMAMTAPAENDFSEFFPVLVNDTWAFMRIESTHSVLIYELDGVLFTLTTGYDYSDLIMLAQSWV